jgi:hypothetical protein
MSSAQPTYVYCLMERYEQQVLFATLDKEKAIDYLAKDMIAFGSKHRFYRCEAVELEDTYDYDEGLDVHRQAEARFDAAPPRKSASRSPWTTVEHSVLVDEQNAHLQKA